jgi:hypothetical protein
VSDSGCRRAPQALLAVVPPRLVLAAALAPHLAPPAVRRRLRPDRNPLLGPLLRDLRLAFGFAGDAPTGGPAGGGGSLGPARGEGGGGEEEEEEDTSYVTVFGDARDGGPEEDGLESRLGPLGRALLTARRCYAHVPDDMEAAHRVIAARQASAAAPTHPPTLSHTKQKLVWVAERVRPRAPTHPRVPTLARAEGAGTKIAGHRQRTDARACRSNKPRRA